MPVIIISAVFVEFIGRRPTIISLFFASGLLCLPLLLKHFDFIPVLELILVFSAMLLKAMMSAAFSSICKLNES